MTLSVLPARPTIRLRLLPGLSLRAGDVLGHRFHVGSLVRVANACALLSGTEQASRKRVSIAVLIAMGEDDGEKRQRYLTGARRAVCLEGPHVARVIETGVTSEGHAFVVREAIPDATLASILLDEPSLPTAHAVDIAIDVCDALDEAHAAGLVHGDVGTHAIHLEWSAAGAEKVKLTDFGTADVLCELAPLSRGMHALSVRAPEQLEVTKNLDARTDVWGVGVVLFTTLAGAPPFAADTPSGVNLSIALDEPASVAGIPDALAELVERCLSKNPALRPQSIVALAQALAPFGSRGEAPLARMLARNAPPVVVTAPEPKPEPVSTKTPSPSIAPVVLSSPSPLLQTVLTRPKSKLPRTALGITAAGLAAVATCAAIAFAVGMPLRTSALETTAAIAPPPIAPAPPPVEAPPVVATPVVATPVVVMPVVVPKVVTPAAPKKSAAPAPPPAAPAPAMKQPQPKASDDDLRRFLDDRR